MDTAETIKLVLLRIKSERERLEISQDEMSEVIGYKGHAAYSLIEGGQRKLTLSLYLEICKALSKPPYFFLGSGTQNLTPEEVEVLDIYRSLPDHAKETGVSMLRGWLAQNTVDHRPNFFERVLQTVQRIKFDVSEIRRIHGLIEGLPDDQKEELEKELDSMFYDELKVIFGVKPGKEPNGPNSIFQRLNNDPNTPR